MTSATQDDRYRALEVVARLGNSHELRVIVVAGEPPSKGRPRFTKTGRPYTPKVTVLGERRLAEAFAGTPTFPGNVSVVCIFYRSSRQRIDVDNMLKAVLDAATRAHVWGDDSQVTALVGIVECDRENPRTIVAFGQHDSSMKRGAEAMIPCAHCEAPFLPTSSKARFCSLACRRASVTRVACGHCGRQFKRTSGNQRFCSRRCRADATRAATAARTHCKRGHELSDENTHVLADGRRRCRRCQADAAKRHRADRSPQVAPMPLGAAMPVPSGEPSRVDQDCLFADAAPERGAA